MKKILSANAFQIFMIILLLVACKTKSPQQAYLYTCPMTEDSIFSDSPGSCPKCGMDLVKLDHPLPHESHETISANDTMYTSGKAYACPMHPQIQADTVGHCPICGMILEPNKSPAESKKVSLQTLIQPSNQQVIASIPMVHMMDRIENLELASLGFITYDPRRAGVIASNYAGRIEKLYIKYRYQKIEKGQKIMDIYSPELLTAQQNILFLLKNDPGNEGLIQASKSKLILLGMRADQMNLLIQTGKASNVISLYSNYSGHVHESGSNGIYGNYTTTPMNTASLTTQELTVKEGMYITKGQNIFTVFDPSSAWAVLNIYASQVPMISVGNKVQFTPESDPQKSISGKIDFIEPYFRDGSRTLTVRVYFNNATLKLPIGTQVKSIIYAGDRAAHWLPEEAILSLGLDNIVFVRSGESFVAKKNTNRNCTPAPDTNIIWIRSTRSRSLQCPISGGQ